MATITFKAKAVPCGNHDGSDRHLRVRVPTLTRKHCDMAAFRKDARYSMYANSDLFPGMLRRIRDRVVYKGGNDLRLDALPPGVRAETTGFLVQVSIEA